MCFIINIISDRLRCGYVYTHVYKDIIDINWHTRADISALKFQISLWTHTIHIHKCSYTKLYLTILF